jgi:pimeloyl-ACP methyl ester carboxylesterase
MQTGDIVVVLPGITGSVLQRGDQDVFALSTPAVLRALWSRGDSIQALALAQDPLAVDVLEDGLRAVRLAADLHVLPGVNWKIDGYTKLSAALVGLGGSAGMVDVRAFPYDWRRDNRVAARQLATAAEGWLRERRADIPGARLILVAHSMGGLVARYYLEVLGGWRDTRRLITIGTPFYGSIKALDFVANGFKKCRGLVDLSDLLRSFTSVYQLLPTYRCMEGTDELRPLTDVAPDVTKLDPQRLRNAVAFHDEIRRAALDHQDDAEYRERGYVLTPVLGIEQPTLQTAAIVGAGVRVSRAHPQDGSAGDGTVPRRSATPQELSAEGGAVYAGTRHASLQNADAVLTTLRGILTAQALGVDRDAGRVTLSVDLEDEFMPDEPITVKVTPSEPGTELIIQLEPVEINDSMPARPVHVDLGFVDQSAETEIPPQPPGIYRLTVSGNLDVEPVSDFVIQLPALQDNIS